MIVRRPSGFIEPCLPSKVARPPSGPLWVHEIKHDGYRLIVRRDGLRVRCFTRNGHDWADRRRSSGELRVSKFDESHEVTPEQACEVAFPEIDNA